MTEPTLHLRTVPFTFSEVTRDESNRSGLLLEGYASVFNEWYEVSDILGQYRERIMQGSFTKSLQERQPKIQMDHGRDSFFGALPIAKPEEVFEDSHGLYVRARLADPAEDFRIGPIREAIRNQTVDGMSIRYAVPRGRDEWNELRDERTVRTGILYELGPVVWPASEMTEIMVRAFASHYDLPTRDTVGDDNRSSAGAHPGDAQRTAAQAAGSHPSPAPQSTERISEATRRRVVATRLGGPNGESRRTAGSARPVDRMAERRPD